MKDDMIVMINGISDQILDSMIEAIGSRSIAECDIQEGDLYDIMLNPDLTEIETIGNNIIITRKDTLNICYLNNKSFSEVIIC